MAPRHQIGLDGKFRHFRRLADFLGARDPKVVPANTDPSQWVFTIPWNTINAEPELERVQVFAELDAVSTLTMNPISLVPPVANPGHEIDAGFAYKIIGMDATIRWPAGTPPPAASRIQLEWSVANNSGGAGVNLGGVGRNDISVEAGVSIYRQTYSTGSVKDSAVPAQSPPSYLNRWFFRINEDSNIGARGGLGLQLVFTHRDAANPYNLQAMPANTDITVQGLLLKIPLESMPIEGI